MILDSLSLDGKVAIITGASQGLGHAMALKFAEAGADIVAASRTKEKLDQTAEEVRTLGRKCLVVPADVTNRRRSMRSSQAAIKEFGRIDVLVNNAGGGDETLGKRLEEITDEQWHRGIDTNLSSQFYGCRAVIPQMLKQNRGKIINVASGYGLRGGKHNYMYACSKGGVIQLTRSMALTYAQNNIQTNCIVPGIFPHNEEMMQLLQGRQVHPDRARRRRYRDRPARGVPRLRRVQSYQRRTHRHRRRRTGRRSDSDRRRSADAELSLRGLHGTQGILARRKSGRGHRRRACGRTRRGDGAGGGRREGAARIAGTRHREAAQGGGESDRRLGREGIDSGSERRRFAAI